MTLSVTFTTKHNTMLDVVDEDDVVIGQALRSDIHAQGLLHREVHVWFVTPQGEIIFQRRAKDKDTFPGLLDASAGGHVEQGQTYEQAALCEIAEETGLMVSPVDLALMHMKRGNAQDALTGARNNVHRAVYGYLFRGRLDTLQVEAGAAEGFVAYPLETLRNIPADLGPQFIPSLLKSEYLALYARLVSWAETQTAHQPNMLS